MLQALRNAKATSAAVERERRRRLICACLLACGAWGCEVGPDYASPELDLPAAYTVGLKRGLESGEVELAGWWQNLGDVTLDALVERAVERNLDLRSALARIRAARAQRGIRTSELWPTVDLSGSFSRTQTSQETPTGTFVPRTSELFATGIEAGWELDAWGRIRRAVEAAEAEIEVSVEDARDVLVSVVAETAQSYVELRTFQERARLALANIELQTQTLELTENQFQANLVSQLDVAQARSILESTRSSLFPLRTGARAAQNRLAVLLGHAPGELEAELSASSAIPVPPSRIAVGVPADLVRRRPDVRRAERALAAQSARIGVATAELYPRLALSGSFGFEAQEAGDLFQRSAAGFVAGPAITWNVFDRRRLRDAITVEDALVEQALADYEGVVLLALEEVENAMAGFVNDQESRDSLDLAVAEARRAVELSRDQYRQGLVDFQSVLDSQRRLFELEDALANTRASITTNLIVLYRALGGGWESLPIVLQGPQGQQQP